MLLAKCIHLVTVDYTTKGIYEILFFGDATGPPWWGLLWTMGLLRFSCLTFFNFRVSLSSFARATYSTGTGTSDQIVFLRNKILLHVELNHSPPPVFNYSYTWNIYILPVPGTVLVWAPNTVSADLVSPPESRESRNQWIRVRQSEYIFKNSEIINYISKNAFILQKMDLYHFHLTNSPYVMTYSDPFATCIPYVMMHLAHIDFATCRIQKCDFGNQKP